MFWKAMAPSEYQAAVHAALHHNVRYAREDVMGFPGSFLDRAIYPDGEFLRDSPSWPVFVTTRTTSAVTHSANRRPPLRAPKHWKWICFDYVQRRLRVQRLEAMTAT